MTLSSALNRNNYTANGVNDTFAYQFRVDDETHLKVYLDDVLQSSGYSVTNVGNDSGGNVVFTGAPDNLAVVTLLREVPLTQPTDIPTQGPLNSSAIEQQLDQLVMQVQQVDEALGRSVVLSVSSDLSGLNLPTPAAGNLIGWNSGADGLANYASSAIAGSIVPTAFMQTLLDDSDAASGRATLGAVGQDGGEVFATSAGTDTITLALAPIPAAYAAGQHFKFKAGGTNTGAVTLNVNGIGAVAIQKLGQALDAGDVTADDIVEVVYDGTQFQMLSPARTLAWIQRNTAQPAFMAGNSATDANQTGNAATVDVICDSEVFDQGSDYNTTTGVFTAPVLGRYRFEGTVRFTGLTAAMTSGRILLVTSNRTYIGNQINIGAVRDAGNTASMHIAVTADLDASDTAKLQVQISNGAGNTAGVEGGNVNTPVTYFSGSMAA